MNTKRITNSRSASPFYLKIVAPLVSTITTFMLFATGVQAQDVDTDNVIVDNHRMAQRSELKPHFGLLTGFATPEGNYRTSAEYGVTFGYQPYIPIAVGLELSTTYNNTSEGPESRDLQRTKLLVQGTYNFGGNVPILSQSYVGVAIGPMIESVNNDDTWEVGTLPTVGFDYPFQLRNGKDISFGANARYLMSSSSAANTFSLNAMAKYWF